MFCKRLASPVHTRIASLSGTPDLKNGGTRRYGLENEKRCAIAKTVHGYETRAAREYRVSSLRLISTEKEKCFTSS